MIIKKQRKAFSMLMAISVMVLMSTVAVFVMDLSGKVVKTTTEQYRKEQAILLAKSYTELAILAVISNERNATHCINTIKGRTTTQAKVDTGEGYQIRVDISFIGNASANLATCNRVLSNAVITPNSPLNIILDTYVEYKELDNTASNWITYHRRSLQKI